MSRPWPYQPVIAAVRSAAGLQAAADLAQAEEEAPRAVFLLGGDIQSLPEFARALRRAGKAVFGHIDLIEGIGRDAAGVRYLASCGLSGLISTRAQLLRAAREEGLMTVQRIFLVDSDSLETGVKMLRDSGADFCEVMPGLVPKAIAHLKERVAQPLIAGGMITQREDVDIALAAGAVAVSTSKAALWRRAINAQ